MTYAIVYCSRTGNTASLAACIRAALPADALVYFGAPDDAALAVDLLFVGFWTDKGSCCESLATFLTRVQQKQIFLFGTAGFGGAPAYFDSILDRVQTNLSPGNRVLGRFMCQGRMPVSVRERYAAMAAQEPERASALLQNFDQALLHPNADDLNRLAEAVRQISEPT